MHPDERTVSGWLIIEHGHQMRNINREWNVMYLEKFASETYLEGPIPSLKKLRQDQEPKSDNP